MVVENIQQDQQDIDIKFMEIALRQADLAASMGEVPIGACVVLDGRVIARAHNLRESENDPAAHAEFIAMERAAEKLGRWRLSGCTVYVTVEPCLMCAGLMVNARIDRCVYGAADKKAGALGTLYSFNADSRLNHNFSVTSGVLAGRCQEIISDFFKMRRKENKAKRKLKRQSLTQDTQDKRLEDARLVIDHIDRQLIRLIDERMRVVETVADYKEDHGLAIEDKGRESEKIRLATWGLNPLLASEVTALMSCLMELSRLHQKQYLEDKD